MSVAIQEVEDSDNETQAYSQVDSIKPPIISEILRGSIESPAYRSLVDCVCVSIVLAIIACDNTVGVITQNLSFVLMNPVIN